MRPHALLDRPESRAVPLFQVAPRSVRKLYPIIAKRPLILVLREGRFFAVPSRRAAGLRALRDTEY